MQLIRPLGFFKCFFASANWRLILGDDDCVIRGRDATTINYLSVEEVTLKGKRFPTLLLRTKDAEFNLKWLGLFSANKKKNALDRKQQQAQERAIEIFYQSDRYISNRDFCRWRDSIPQGSNQFFKRAYVGLPERNEKYVREEEVRFRPFFDKVEDHPLTDEQRRAAIVMEDRNLLIAAAGSGKTSAIIGKIGYILEKGLVPPSQILALAFNRSAAKEIGERLAQRIGQWAAASATVKTFHKCGLDIISHVHEAKPSPPSWTGNMGEKNTHAHDIWGEMIEGIAAKDSAFGDNLDALLTCFRWAIKPLHLFESRDAYERHLLALRAKKANDEGRSNWGAPTINGEYVRSLEEVQIANWLYINGIEYQYEKPYEHDTATVQYGQYKPDFYYPQIGVYHEHFALDKSGRAPSFFTPGYAAQAQRKREMHARRKTKLIETTSAMFQSGEVFGHLKKQLLAHGAVFNKRRTFGEVTKQLQEHIIRPLYEIMYSFLKHWKSSDLSEGELFAEAKTQPGFQRMRTELFLRIMIRIRQEYEEKLRAANEIDFEDMVIKAEELLRLNRYCHPYNIILVDEFQDISRSRARLIKAMLNQNLDCKMFAVGDDWQAIYRFAGSDVTVMTDFAEEFGKTAKNRLEKTFRSNQGIADVAADFVSKNPSQEQKQVKAKNTITSRVVQVVNYFTPKEVESFIARQLHQLSGKSARVYILARYNHLKPESLSEWRKKFDATLDIKFSTIHRAKGQEADYVFVLGMDAGQYGFPSEIEEDPVLQLVMPKQEKLEYAEERRLFYVALTRARHKVFLLANKQRRSRFVDEISAGHTTSVYENDIGKDGEPIPSVALPKCPRCGGVLRQRESHYGKDFMGCSNSPKCRYQESIPNQK